ncbi:MAG: methylaspartate mutase subunit E [Kiritimatiellae bacterium]|nr:methylaspartate mutase subunit E [Kiritimatiellia bacterium]
MRQNAIRLKKFLSARESVLSAWPTGGDIRLEEAVRYQNAIPEKRRFAAAVRKARENRRILLQPRAGVSLVDEHIKLLRYLESEGGADLLPTTIDAYTRQNNYAEAAKGIEKSIAANTSLLNGFPAVNHGLAECRRVVENVSRPIQIRHGTPDARLLAEITLAAGFTSFEGGGISYNIPYAKNAPLRKSLADWQYVDRLAGYYGEEGALINREPFGPLTGTLVPPCISHAIGILEGLLALEQGVKSLTLGYGQGGNMIQDIAAVRSLRALARNYFHGAGFDDCDLTVVFHQWMGGFPEDEAKAFAVIAWGAAVARFSGAEKIIVKTPHEAMGIPTKEANTQGLKATRQIINMLADQHFGDNAAVEREMKIITEEVNCILERVFALGKGELAEGVIAAFAAGVLDVPFAPSVYNRGQVLPMRDNDGCIRLFKAGGLPLTEELKTFHRDRLQERAGAEGRDVCFQMVTDDIYAISKGKLVGRPR